MDPRLRLDTRTAARCLFALNPRRLYHRAEIEFADRLPASGGAVVVSNHGRLDLDCFILVALILRSRGRPVRLLADHLWFRVPGVRRLWSLAGAVDGTRENALCLLEAGEMVLVYPGGVREVLGGRYGHEHIDWSGRTGFAKVAVAAGVPVIPLVGVGVNNGFAFLTGGRLLGRLLFQGILRLGAAYGAYRNPLVLGILPVPLPFSLAVHFPLPCRVRYVVGEPIYPTVAAERTADGDPDAGEEGRAAELAARVTESMRTLIGTHGNP